MNSFITIFLFIAVIIMALAIIGLAIWVAVLGGRLNRMSDLINYWQAQNAEQLEERPSVQLQEQVVYERPQERPSPEQCERPHERPHGEVQYERPHEEMFEKLEAQRDAEPPHAETRQADVMQTASPSQAQTQTSDDEPEQTSSGMQINRDGKNNSAFFENYTRRDKKERTDTFRRRPTPTIPFGQDKTDDIRRKSYTEEAVENDFDPDTIDFSRVASYRERLGL